MSFQQRDRTISLTGLVAIASLLIVIVSAHSLFPELLFYSIVMILIGVIVVLVGYALLWERTSQHVRTRLWRRKQNILARKCFEEFTDFVDRFTSLREFRNAPQGITDILSSLPLASEKVGHPWTHHATNEFASIVQNPLNDLKSRLNVLRFYRSEVNQRILLNLAKEFENYIMLHKRLYVDLTVIKAGEIGLEHISEVTKRAYREYRDDYNQFVIAYTEFAKKTSKELGVFNANLPKASEL